MRAFFKRLKTGTEHLNYGRHIIRSWGAEAFRAAQREGRGKNQPFRILDLGCGKGDDLLGIRAEAGSPSPAQLELHGVENYPPSVEILEEAGVVAYDLDIERDLLPGGGGDFDIVIANQVLEHVKEVFWILAEAARVLRPGGLFIAGVPNLASLHNRLLLLVGQQPTPIQTFSAHVRGFTKPDMRGFAERGGYFRLTGFRGSNFYPFPAPLARPLARVLPTMAWGAFFRLQRTDKRDGSFLDNLLGEDNFLETPFFGSPMNPAPPRRAPRLQKPRSARSKHSA